MSIPAEPAAAPTRSRTERELELFEQRLLVREQHLDEALHLAQLGCWELDLATDKLAWTRETFVMFGADPATFVPTLKTLDDIVCAEDRPKIDAAIHCALHGKKVPEFTLRARTLGGRELILACRATVIRGDRGAPCRMIGTVQDVTQRERDAEALRRSEERFQIVARATSDTIWDLDLTTGRLACTANAEQLFGALPENGEATTDWWISRLHPEDATRVVENMLAVIERRDTVWTSEHRVVHSDGHFVHVLDRGFVLRDEQGKATRLIGSVMDITARKAIDEHRAALVWRLEAANRELNEFAYVVSHDLKAPLRGISTLAGWIADDYADRLDDEGREQLGLLLSRTKRLNGLIEGILRYSQAGRLAEECAEVELGKLVPDVIDLLGAPDHVAITIEGTLPAVWGSRTGLHQVFQNLLSNAVKFSDKAQSTVRVSCDEEAGMYRFAVADNGPGIEEKHFEKIFQLFQTLKPRDEFESTGIGLAIVKKVVEMSGGTTWLESRVGEGTTFFFTLPKGGSR